MNDQEMHCSNRRCRCGWTWVVKRDHVEMERLRLIGSRWWGSVWSLENTLCMGKECQLPCHLRFKLGHLACAYDRDLLLIAEGKRGIPVKIIIMIIFLCAANTGIAIGEVRQRRWGSISFTYLWLCLWYKLFAITGGDGVRTIWNLWPNV